MKTLFKNKINSALVVAAATLTTPLHAASTVTASDDFYEFHTMVEQWSSGGLAIGLSLAALIIGGGIGVAKASPMPALGGVGLAAFFAFGPKVIQQLIGGGAVLF